MGFKELIQAYIIGQGSHTGGHFIQAQNPDNPMRDVPMKLDARNLVENWDIPDKWSPPREDNPYKDLHMSHKDYLADNNRKSADIHGAGFAEQDRIRNLIDDPETKKDVSIVNALIKGAYLAGVPMKLSKQIRSGGDIEGMEATSGNKHIKEFVGASALWDLLKGTGAIKNQNIDYGFDVIDGAPGGRITARW